MIDSEKVQAILSKLQVKMEEDPDILAVILYGSYARGGGGKQGMWIYAWFYSQIKPERALING